MEERKLTDIEIRDFSDREESHFYDNKAFGINGKKIQKISVAFANADGGEFVIGIKDKKDEPDISKRWQGIEDKESFNDIFQNIAEITPTVPYSFEFLKDSSGKYALRIIIEKSESVHKTSDSRRYAVES